MELSLKKLADFAETYLGTLPKMRGTHAYVVGLSGELGAGKTTFVQALARALGVKASVQSPTFTFIRTYDITHPVFSKLVHVDAYRLREGEGNTIDLESYVSDPQNLVIIEWYENVSSSAIRDIPVIEFAHVAPDTRRVTVHGT